MKKVRSSSQLKVTRGNQVSRSTNININSVDKPRNKMVNKDALKGKTGGTNFGDYSLDLMKLR